jgi:hypothetical protein
VTFAEIAPDAKDYPGALPHMLKAGSLVFRPPSTGKTDDLEPISPGPPLSKRQMEDSNTTRHCARISTAYWWRRLPFSW